MQTSVNVVIAAYTTALARLHLYSNLDKLQENCLYYDTDSVIFICKNDEKVLSLGDNLGDLTDELTEYGGGSYISEIVITAEKSYSFIVNSPGQNDSVVCKVKGINLNYKNSCLVNFESMKDLVLRNRNAVIRLQNFVILRTDDSRVYSTNQEYNYKVNATKRMKVGTEAIHTLPYGYTN